MRDDPWDNSQSDEPVRMLENIEAEAALLGAFMMDNRILDHVSGELKPEHFAVQLHARIYKTILHLRDTDTSATPITVRPYFERDEDMLAVGGAGYLAKLTGSGAGMLGATSFAKQVRQLAQMRQMRDTLRAGADQIEENSRSQEPRPVTEISAEISSELLAATEDAAGQQFVSVGRLLRRVRDRRQRAIDGISIGAMCATVTDLNVMMGGAAPGTLIMIGGRPGMGKSVLAQSAAWGYALNGHPTLMISLEMSKDAQAMRQAADLSFGMNEPVSFKTITRNQLTESDLLIIDEAERRVENLPLTMIAPGRVTIEQIEALVAQHVAKLKRQGKRLEVLFVDYVQIIAASGKKEGRERIDHISERLLAIAKRHDLAVFALSQLVRDIDKRPDKRPTPADLKESGRLEEDADVVILIFRPEFYLRREEPKKEDAVKWEAWNEEFQHAQGRVDLIFDKLRMGEPGTKRARFFGDCQAIRGSDFVLPSFVDENPLLHPGLAEKGPTGP